MIEFESSPLLMVGHALGLRVSLIAYPVISIKKASHSLTSGSAVYPASGFAAIDSLLLLG